MVLSLCFVWARAADGIALVQRRASAAQIQTASMTSDISSATSACSEDVHFFDDADCNLFETWDLCKERRKNITWLASYPGSGNTWTRTLLEHATGIFTGSMYEDESLIDASLVGEGNVNPADVVVVKTHASSFPAMPSKGTRAIILIRSPLPAALSRNQIALADKLGGNMHTFEVSYEALRSRFDRFRQLALENWRDFYTFWTRFPGDVMFLRYEDLEMDTRGTLTRLVLPFLGLNVSRLKSRLDCVEKTETQAIRRNHSYIFNFTDEDREVAQRILGDLPTTFGYEI